MEGSGTLSGVPTTPGIYWVQVWVNERPGQVATHRDYRLVVTGKANTTQPSTATAKADDHELIATLGAWPEEDLALLRERMQTAKLHAVLQESEDKSMMLLVPASEAHAAREIVTRLMRDRPKTTPTELAR
jgi:hypothetical protein